MLDDMSDDLFDKTDKATAPQCLAILGRRGVSVSLIDYLDIGENASF